MKILFVSCAIYPSRGAVAQVTEPLASNFTKAEMCVVGEQILFMGRIKHAEEGPDFHYLRTNLTLKGKGKRFLANLRWIIMLPYLLWSLNKIYKKEQCSYIIGTFPDNFYLFGAYLVAKWNNAGFSSYFHNTYLENRSGGFRKRWAAWIQPMIFRYSDNIFVMSEGMKAYYDKKHPDFKDKVVPLPHTFAKYPEYPARDWSQVKEQYDLVLIGNFTDSNLEATRRLIQALKGIPKYRIKMFTHVPKAFLRLRGIDLDAIDYRGYIRQEDFFKELMDNDICMLTHGFTGGYSREEYETIFPTRTIPFLISGIPIFAHSPDFSFLNHFLKKYDCAEIVEVADEEQIRQQMEMLLHNPSRKEQLVRNAQAVAKHYYAPNVATFLKKRIGFDFTE